LCIENLLLFLLSGSNVISIPAWKLIKLDSWHS
jgi:hypothetical protein